MAALVEPLSLGKLYTQLGNWEQRKDLLHGSRSSVNSATHGGRSGGNGHGRGRGNGRDGGGRHNGSSVDRPTCHVCGKKGHAVLRCYKRFDASFTGPLENKSASAASTSYGIDTNWYTETGTTDHITGELDKLTVRDKYHGTDQVHRPAVRV